MHGLAIRKIVESIVLNNHVEMESNERKKKTNTNYEQFENGIFRLCAGKLLFFCFILVLFRVYAI